MAKFHINKHGVPAPCRAKAGNCPLGGDSEHFATKEEAQSHVDRQQASKYGLMGVTNSGKLDTPSIEQKITKTLNSYSNTAVVDSLIEQMSPEEFEDFTDKTIESYHLGALIAPRDTAQEKFDNNIRHYGGELTLNFMKDYFGEKRLESMLEKTEKTLSEVEPEGPASLNARMSVLSSLRGGPYVSRQLANELDQKSIEDLNKHLIEKFKVDPKEYAGLSPRDTFEELGDDLENRSYGASINAVRDVVEPRKLQRALDNYEDKLESISRLGRVAISPKYQVAKTLKQVKDSGKLLENFVNMTEYGFVDRFADYAKASRFVEDNYNSTDPAYHKLNKITEQLTDGEVLTRMGDMMDSYKFERILNSAKRLTNNEPEEENFIDEKDYL
jgi:hypothetical protein